MHMALGITSTIGVVAPGNYHLSTLEPSEALEALDVKVMNRALGPSCTSFGFIFLRCMLIL